MINMLLMLQYSSVKYPYAGDNMSIVTKFNQEKPTKTGQLPSELYEKNGWNIVSYCILAGW